ncbi:MAG: deaminase, partial [Acidobacteria bacterium]|nr:deaminase [Acidobacteriota bacterium]
ANAILQAAKNGVRIEGAGLYTTASPCWGCFKLIANAGIKTVFYSEFYREKKSLAVARRLGIELIDLGPGGGGDWRPPPE